MAKWQLGGAYKTFTGILNGQYKVRNGVVVTNDDLEPKASKAIREFHGAVEIKDPPEKAPELTQEALDEAVAKISDGTNTLEYTVSAMSAFYQVDAQKLEVKLNSLLADSQGE